MTNDNDYWQTRQNGEVTAYNLAYYELLQDMAWLEATSTPRRWPTSTPPTPPR